MDAKYVFETTHSKSYWLGNPKLKPGWINEQGLLGKIYEGSE